jgi:hypothetical protein
MASTMSRSETTVSCTACRLCGAPPEAPWHAGEVAADLNFPYEPCGLLVRMSATPGRCSAMDRESAPDHLATGHHHHQQWEHLTLEGHVPGCGGSTADQPRAVDLTSSGCCAGRAATGDTPAAELAIVHNALLQRVFR